MVARVTLQEMCQDRDEPVQAGVCKYIIKYPNCDHDVNYIDPMVRDVLARGICDNDIQLDLLGNSNQDMSLEEVTRLVEVKDARKRSSSRRLDSHAVESASSYRKSK